MADNAHRPQPSEHHIQNCLPIGDQGIAGGLVRVGDKLSRVQSSCCFEYNIEFQILLPRE